ncbi:MAG: zf-HC2 domain-containing protein [Chthonomonadales bacterium]|nr:zf-HC2 domain-containing protein [Chthonomonadales bacterium]
MQEQLSTCDVIWDLLSAYADQEASPDEAARVERHVAACRDCARGLAFLRSTSLELGALPSLEPPPGLRDAILAATVLRPTPGSRVRAALSSLATALSPRAGYLAGAAASALLLAALFAHRPPEPAPQIATRRVLARVAAVPRQAPAPEPTPHAPRVAARSQAEPTPSARPESAPRQVAMAVSHPGLRRRDAPHAMRSAPHAPPHRAEHLALGGADRLEPRPSGSAAGLARAPAPAEPDLPAPDANMAPAPSPRIEIAGRPADEPPTAASDRDDAGSEHLHLRVASARTVEPGAISTLADLRASLRRKAGMPRARTAALDPDEPREVMVELIQTRF